MDTNNLNGLQLIKLMAMRKIPLPNITKIIPMLEIKTDRGKMKIKVRADERHYNSQHIVHGGFAATVLDTAMACAIQTMLGPGSSPFSIDLDIKYVKPIPANKDLYAKGELSEMTGSLGFAKGRLVDEKGNLYAEASTSCMLL